MTESISTNRIIREFAEWVYKLDLQYISGSDELIYLFEEYQKRSKTRMDENICIRKKENGLRSCPGYMNGNCISIENCRYKIKKPEIDEITKDFVKWLDNNQKYVIHEKSETDSHGIVNVVTGAEKILEEYENYLLVKEIDMFRR